MSRILANARRWRDFGQLYFQAFNLTENCVREVGVIGILRQWFRNIRRGYGLYASSHKLTSHIPPGTLAFGEPPNTFPIQTNGLLVGSVGAFGLGRDTEATHYYGQLVVCQWQRDNVLFSSFVLVVSHPPSQNGRKSLL
jgi:hypothetical protein